VLDLNIMTHFRKIQAFAILLLALMVAPVSEASSKPNIVLIMADDIGWEALKCYGGEDYETPHLDRLASEGIRFEHCYSTPICTTSRVMLMTGQYNFRNYTHFGYLNPKDKTFGHLLKDAGYKTGIAGKWQLNGLYNQLEGHDKQSRVHDAGFDDYCLWQLSKTQAEGGERFWEPLIEVSDEKERSMNTHGQYGPDLMCDFICDFMERNKDQAFFAYYPMVLVHDPFIPTPASKIGETVPSNKQSKDKGELKKHFQAMVNYMDGIVGEIVAKTEELGIAENTLILFTSDNGTHQLITSKWNGKRVQGGKSSMKDTGTHVPLIAYWKGHSAKGVVCDDLVDFTDFYPTLAELAGVELGEGDPVDGRSFLPQILGEQANPREWVFCHYQPYWNKKPGQFVRTAKYKLYRDGRFYETAMDLEEKNDLSKKLDSERLIDVHRKSTSST
jgi:arylsulfatase A